VALSLEPVKILTRLETIDGVDQIRSTIAEFDEFPFLADRIDSCTPSTRGASRGAIPAEVAYATLEEEANLCSLALCFAKRSAVN
jgi:hypothetical protein